MNLFLLDEDPTTCAQMLCDQHVVKMSLEAAQMLSTAILRHCPSYPVPCRKTHPGHPVTRWAGDTRDNYECLLSHAFAIIEEHYWRLGLPGRVLKSTGKPSKTERHLKDLAKLSHLIPAGAQTPYAQAVGEYYYNPDDPVLAYQHYYVAEKNEFRDGSFARWTKRSPPRFFLELIDLFNPNWVNRART